jgi:hypothetical protein
MTRLFSAAQFSDVEETLFSRGRDKRARVHYHNLRVSVIFADKKSIAGEIAENLFRIHKVFSAAQTDEPNSHLSALGFLSAFCVCVLNYPRSKFRGFIPPRRRGG